MRGIPSCRQVSIWLQVGIGCKDAIYILLEQQLTILILERTQVFIAALDKGRRAFDNVNRSKAFCITYQQQCS